MANTFVTINMATREAVRLWKNANAFLQNVDMQYDDSFGVAGAKIGSSLRIRLPNDFVGVKGPALDVQDTAEQYTTLVLATQAHVDVAYSEADRTLSLDDYSRRVLAPMVNTLAGIVAVDIMQGSEGGICNIVGNTDVNANILAPIQSTYLRAGAVLRNNSSPVANWKIVNSPDTEASVVSSLAGLLNPAPEISRQYVTGRMYDALGFIWMADQTVISHTNGALAQGSGQVNGSGQTGLNLTVTSLAASVAMGDILTVGGVHQVNRITKQSTGRLRTFAATSAVASTGTTIPIYPAIVPPQSTSPYIPAQYQTVDASPISGAYVNPALGLAASAAYTKNFAYAPEAVTLATADLEMPRNVHEAERVSFDGVSMRMVTDYFIGTDQLITRLDVLYGYLWIRPEWACIVADQIYQ